MLDLRSLSSIKNKVKSRDDKRFDDYKQSFTEGLDYLEKFIKSGNISRTYLIKSSEKLIEATKLKRSEAEPYICLAYIFYVLSDVLTASDYLRTALLLEPDNVEAIAFQEIITAKASAVIHHKEDVETTEEFENNEIVEKKEPVKIKSIPRVTRLKK